MHLTEATWTDVRDADADVAYLPVGSTEQHGPHAPLGTDALAAEAVAAAGAETLDDREVLVAPPIPVGVAEEHRQFPGTMWVGEDTFRSYVRESAESLAYHGIERLVVVNGHGGNVSALQEVCGRLSRDGTVYAVPFTWFDAVDTEERMGHGGPVETAMVAHVRPDLVREERFEEAAAGASDGWGEWEAGTNRAYDSAAFTESGAVGDPRDGDADLGERLLERSAEALAELTERIVERDPSPPADRR